MQALPGTSEWGLTTDPGDRLGGTGQRGVSLQTLCAPRGQAALQGEEGDLCLGRDARMPPVRRSGAMVQARPGAVESTNPLANAPYGHLVDPVFARTARLPPSPLGQAASLSTPESPSSQTPDTSQGDTMSLPCFNRLFRVP